VELNCQGGFTGWRRPNPARSSSQRPDHSIQVSSWYGAAAAMFTPAEMRHNFAIWALKKDTDSTRQRHLYYCVRCKQAFRVDDRSGSVTPLDLQGDPIQVNEAMKRLATFSNGPCPAFSGLITGPRLTTKVIPIRTVRGRVTRLILAGRRTWKAVVGQWR
jgi:hypothetical protein